MQYLNAWLWGQPKWLHRAIAALTGKRLKVVMTDLPDGSRLALCTWVPVK